MKKYLIGRFSYRTDQWKEEEVARLKAEQGIVELEEPMVASEVWQNYQNSL